MCPVSSNPNNGASRAVAAAMHLKNPAVTEVLTRRAAYEDLLPLAGARLLELGCGPADITREIAAGAAGVSITALEVDRIQHQKNAAIRDLPNVTFALGGAEDIPAPDASFDIVAMFHSLHHVPLERMDRAMLEIRRVLKPGGLAYFEEPVFDGEYCEILRIYHDEQHVREAAFLALERAVDAGVMELATEKFFLITKPFADWAQYERMVRERTHTEHRLTDAQWQAMETRFMRSMTPAGALFMQPLRADLLRRPMN
jgi:ubiquinone/menaquinone biosynthesis C-methylase UbiE